MAPQPTWDDIFGDLDARSLDHHQRLDFINAEIERVLDGRTWTALVAGEEGQLAWDAAIRTFLDGIWVASIFCCHVVCEREVAGVLSLSRARLNDALPANWESFGLGRLLNEVTRFGLLPDDLIRDIQELADVRKPYGHWRSADHPESLLQRVRAEHELTGHEVWGELRDRLIVRDATKAMRTTIRLYFGSYGMGAPHLGEVLP